MEETINMEAQAAPETETAESAETGEKAAGSAAPQNTQDLQSSQDPQSSQDTAKEQTNKEEKPKRDFERDSAFAAMRRENARLSRLLNAYKSGAKAQGYDGSDEEIVQKFNADALGLTLDEYKAKYQKEQAEAEKRERLEEELEALREEKRNRVFEDDLKAIKDAYPEVKAKSIRELGEKYWSLMKTGELSAVEAYEVIRKLEERGKKTPPPSTGSVKQVAGKTEKEFYSSEEVDELSEKDLDDPKILNKVLKSMTKWRK